MHSQPKTLGINLQVVTETDVAEHIHHDIELLYVMEGSIRLTVEEEKYELHMDDVVIINPGHRHTISRGDGTLACIITLDPRLFKEYSNRLLFWCNSLRDSDDSYTELRKILHEMLLEYINHQPHQSFQRYSLYYQLLQFIATHYLVNNTDVGEETREEKNAARAAEIVSYIENHYDRDLSLQELAEHLYLSNAYLSKYFKRTFHVNFIDYVNALRLHHATEDLLYTEKPITHIALDNGFASVASFNKLFRKVNDKTPSVYRQQMKGKASNKPAGKRRDIQEAEIKQRLRRHLHIERKAETFSPTSDPRLIGDTRQATAYKPTWDLALNLGAAKLLLQSDVRECVQMAHKELGFRYLRIWSLFAEEFNIVNHHNHENLNFNRLDAIISFLLQNNIRPFIELGEKPERIQVSPQEAVLSAKNVSQFESYEEFLSILDRTLAHLASQYGMAEVEQWIFELWDDHRVEVYADKRTYRMLYRDVNAILRKHVPKAKLGGAGNHMGWHKEDTTTSIRRWIDEGIYPDFISYDYYPYASLEAFSEADSKIKTDEDDFLHTLLELRKKMLEYGFPPRELYVTDWNSTISQRNPLNDCCWKGCYILRNLIDSLGQVDMVAYSQLSDVSGDYNDVPGILGGMAGLVSRDGIRKPAYYAYQFLGRLHGLLLGKNDHAILTWDGHGRFSIAMHNYKVRNYLYFFKHYGDLSMNELYQYFENMDNKRVDVELRNIPNGKYVLRKAKLNRQHGSVMDEWMQMACFDHLRKEDLAYLRDVCTPHITLSVCEVTDGTLYLPNDLQPLEIDLIELTRMN